MSNNQSQTRTFAPLKLKERHWVLATVLETTVHHHPSRTFRDPSRGNRIRRTPAKQTTTNIYGYITREGKEEVGTLHNVTTLAWTFRTKREAEEILACLS